MAIYYRMKHKPHSIAIKMIVIDILKNTYDLYSIYYIQFYIYIKDIIPRPKRIMNNWICCITFLYISLCVEYVQSAWQKRYPYLFKLVDRKLKFRHVYYIRILFGKRLTKVLSLKRAVPSCDLAFWNVHGIAWLITFSTFPMLQITSWCQFLKIILIKTTLIIGYNVKLPTINKKIHFIT